jgi:Uncharacterized protein conserved in bacteria (DUF2252)
MFSSCRPGDAAMIAGYVGKSDALDEALTKFAFAYSEPNDQDYAELKKAAPHPPDHSLEGFLVVKLGGWHHFR